MKRFCQHLDKFSEVHTLIGDIVENGLVAVALVFHVADLHLQSQVLGDLPALNHRAVLTALGLLIFIHIHWFGDAVYASDLVSRFQVGFLQLQLHQPSRQCHHADVVTGIRLHGHDVAFLQIQIVHIVVVTLAGILELHLYQVCRLSIARHVGQPIIGVELFVLPADATATQTTVASGTYMIITVYHELSS